MGAQLGDLLLALREHQHQIVIAYFCLAALSWKYCAKFRSFFTSPVLISTVATLTVLTISAYILTIVLYLLYPNYFDHIQPLVASISWLWIHGYALYPNWTTDDAYISIFGPLTFLVNGMALLLGPSIFASKLPGVLCLGVALAATSILLKRTTDDGLTSLFLSGSLVLLFGTFHEYVYWNRPEPFLILASVLALLITIASRPSSLVAAAGIGVLAGVSAALKLHGFLYLVPAVAVALARVETLRGRFIMAIIGSLCAAAFALLPYLEKGVSIFGYLRFLRVAFKERWLASSLIENFVFVFVLMTPIIVTGIWRKLALTSLDRSLFAGLGLSAATVTMIGAKIGAGSYYLLPLVPISIYGVAIVCARFKREAKETAALLFVSFFLAYGPNLLLDMLSYLHRVAGSSEREKIAELKTYIDSYPDAQIGVSDDEHYSSYFYRVLSVWSGRPLHVDFTAWMDLAYVGVDEEHVARFIKGCAVQTWILPLGTPFTTVNFYTRLPILSESFRQTFSINYRQIEIGRAYQVWQCNTRR